MSSKNKLQERLQRQGRGLPTYMCTKNGPDHAPRFIATVKLDNGQTFQSPHFCLTMKQAENAAADAALDALKNQDHNPVKPNGGPLTVQNQTDGGSSNLQEEAKKNDRMTIVVANGERKEETLQQPEIVRSSSKLTVATMWENNQLKDETSQTAQRPRTFPNSSIDVFPSSRIQIVPLQRFTISENSGKGSDKQNVDNSSSMIELSGNGINKEKWQHNEEIIQQSEIPDMHKNQLQEYAVRRGFDYPCYSCTREGPAHAPRFKAMVKFDGETFESPGFFNTLRQAEHAAAAVALKSLSDIGPYLDESSMCKSLLQDKAQKEGNPLPEYNTTRSGPSHMPLFTCTVKFNEMIFEGKAAKTKKQAEKNAASVAWSALKHSRSSSTLQDKPKALVGKLNNPPHVEVINHMKEGTDRQSHGQLFHLGTGHSAVAHSDSSEAFSTASKKEMGQNITASVLENRGNDQVQCPSKRLSPTKHSEGTRIRVMPVPDTFKKWPLDSSDLSSSGKPWVAVNLTEPPNHEKYK